MKKPSAVLPICPVILGTWALCGWMRGGFDRREAFRTLSAAVDRGVDGFDTAPVYGLGAAECLLGEFSRGFRHRLYIADKCGMVWHTDAGKRTFYADENGTRRAGGHCVRLHLHPESMRFELEQSLRRLQSDYIDLYQIHWYDGVTPWDDIMETMLRFRDEGKIREIGVCNVSTEKMLRCLKTAPLASDQERLRFAPAGESDFWHIRRCHSDCWQKRRRRTLFSADRTLELCHRVFLSKTDKRRRLYSANCGRFGKNMLSAAQRSLWRGF